MRAAAGKIWTTVTTWWRSNDPPRALYVRLRRALIGLRRLLDGRHPRAERVLAPIADRVASGFDVQRSWTLDIATMTQELQTLGDAVVGLALGVGVNSPPPRMMELPNLIRCTRLVDAGEAADRVGPRLFADVIGDRPLRVSAAVLRSIERGAGHVERLDCAGSVPLVDAVWPALVDLAWLDPAFRHRQSLVLMNAMRDRVLFTPGERLAEPTLTVGGLWWLVGMLCYRIDPHGPDELYLSLADLRRLCMAHATPAARLGFWDQWLIAESARLLVDEPAKRWDDLPAAGQWPALCRAPAYSGLPSICRSGEAVTWKSDLSRACGDAIFAPLLMNLELENT